MGVTRAREKCSLGKGCTVMWGGAHLLRMGSTGSVTSDVRAGVGTL